MQKNTICLIKAAERLGLEYDYVDANSNFIKVKIAGSWEYFQSNRTPFNSQVQYGICLDKMHTYTLLSDQIRMPVTMSFLDWNVKQEYRKYLHYTSQDQAIAAVENQFDYPLIVKQNRGSLGTNVYLCANNDDIANAFGEIFNRNSSSYDYISLAQEYIYAEEEYRLICAFGEPVLAYRRGNAKGFNARYWEKGEQAILIEDQQLIDRLYGFVKPVYTVFDIGLAGFDIILGENGYEYLIEINSAPKVDHVIEGNGEDCVVTMYEKILKIYSEESRGQTL